MIDVNDNAKAAVREFALYIGQSDKCERYLEAFETKKTVADAYEAFASWKHPEFKFVFWYEPIGFVYRSSSDAPDEYQLVCTREQFEAYAKEQEAKQDGEKWTHTHGGGVKCKVIAVDGDHSWVLGEDGRKVTEYTSSLKPIKPTISEDAKRQLELYVQYRFDKYGNYNMKSDLSDYLSHHEII